MHRHLINGPPLVPWNLPAVAAEIELRPLET